MLAPGAPDNPIQVIDVRDLATWIMNLVERRVTGTYNAVSPPGAFTMGDLISLSLRASPEVRTEVTWVSADFLARHFTQDDHTLQPWLPASGSTAGAGLMTARRAAKAGLKSRPLCESVRDTLHWFQSQPLERQEQLRSGLDSRREAHLLQAWKRNDEKDDELVIDPSERGFSYCGKLKEGSRAASLGAEAPKSCNGSVG